MKKTNYKHAWYLLGWVWYFAMYLITERFIPESRCHVVHSVVDDWIPFNEHFVIIYTFWYLLVAGSLAYFFFKDAKSFIALQKFIITCQVIAMIVYILWPSVQYLRPEVMPRENIFASLLQYIYSVDTPTGVCPSLHVAFSIGIASTWLKKKDARKGLKIFVVIAAILISLSVLFVKQHSFVDVVAAIPLCFVAEMTAFKRTHYGDRRDGKLLRDLDSMHYIMPLMYPNRCDNEAYMTMTIDLEKTERFIRSRNKDRSEDDRYSLFGLIICAVLMTIDHRPQMNRFIANKNVYQRNDITAAFTVKKTLSDDGDETLARIQLHDGDNLDSIQKQVNEQIRLCKVEDDQSTKSMNFIQKLPFKHAIGAAARWADRHGWMPASVIETDPYQCSVVLTNLGSIGMGIGYHHLMNWGTTSIFVVIGQKKNVTTLNRHGEAETKRVLKLSFTIDERISDGYYYGKSMRFLKKILENPELME
ncbi:MAG: 2-oxo acid dehydrogenase subunit E2 [Eubacteriales bacterium]|nr:2-oxo acid dehydrogenase subunit E2 [Eubacteriales bacterium]